MTTRVSGDRGGGLLWRLRLEGSLHAAAVTVAGGHALRGRLGRGASEGRPGGRLDTAGVSRLADGSSRVEHRVPHREAKHHRSEELRLARNV